MCDQHRQTHTGRVAQRNDWKTKHTNTHINRHVVYVRLSDLSFHRIINKIWHFEDSTNNMKQPRLVLRPITLISEIKKNLRFVNIRIHRVMFRFNATIYRLQAVKTTLNWIREKTLSYCILPQTWTWLYLFLHSLVRSFVSCIFRFDLVHKNTCTRLHMCIYIF